MLALSRGELQSLTFDVYDRAGNREVMFEVKVVGWSSSQVRLAIEAPLRVRVYRTEKIGEVDADIGEGEGGLVFITHKLTPARLAFLQGRAKSQGTDVAGVLSDLIDFEVDRRMHMAEVRAEAQPSHDESEGPSLLKDPPRCIECGAPVAGESATCARSACVAARATHKTIVAEEGSDRFGQLPEEIVAAAGRGMVAEESNPEESNALDPDLI